ncbi:hypothetical protein VN97_g7963 [Penicillium thymicola]|uniref:Uncharacterized protein n=1 Tax=Penicillium thymicola TaxID=293382 RepID=A0AAI9TFD5_PENTH|nr:hypothetical protein VN97_g7963 [Penicillium thymicola]
MAAGGHMADQAGRCCNTTRAISIYLYYVDDVLVTLVITIIYDTLRAIALRKNHKGILFKTILLGSLFYQGEIDL